MKIAKIAVTCVGILSLAIFCPGVRAADRDVWFDDPVPAINEKFQTSLHVESYGKYCITVTSNVGVAVQLVDKMAGPGPINGTPGLDDGRLDVFLEKGEHRIVMYGPKGVAGSAKLHAEKYRELSSRPFPILTEEDMRTVTLEDCTRRTFRLPVLRKGNVFIEAAGRNLDDARLWMNEEWMLPAQTIRDKIEPVAGEPLAVVRISKILQKGVYTLTFYGGKSKLWTQNDSEHPLHIRTRTAGFGYCRRSAFQDERFRI